MYIYIICIYIYIYIYSIAYVALIQHIRGMHDSVLCFEDIANAQTCISPLLTEHTCHLSQKQKIAVMAQLTFNKTNLILHGSC